MDNETNKNVKYNISHQIINGVAGGSLNAIVGHPFDTIRVRMQCVNSSYSSSRECVKTTIKTEGVRALFNGMVPSFLSMVAETSIVILTNDIMKHKLLNSNISTSTNFYNDALIGSVSGFLGSIVSCPCETLKCSMQTKHHKYTMIELSKNIGIKGLFSGFGATCGRNIPFYCGFFPLYSRFLDILNMHKVDKSKYPYHNILSSSMAGGASGVVAWSIVYPFDVIKSNQQVYHNNKSIYWTMCNIIKTRGFIGIYAGLIPTLVRAFLANSALMAGIEMGNLTQKH
jgi:hypothetical protein